MENSGTVTLSLKEYNELYELKRLWDKGGCIFDSYSHYNSRYLYFDKDETMNKIAEEIKAMAHTIQMSDKRIADYLNEMDLLNKEIKKLKAENQKHIEDVKNLTAWNTEFLYENKRLKSKQKRKRWLF